MPSFMEQMQRGAAAYSNSSSSSGSGTIDTSELDNIANELYELCDYDANAQNGRGGMHWNVGTGAGNFDYSLSSISHTLNYIITDLDIYATKSNFADLKTAVSNLRKDYNDICNLREMGDTLAKSIESYARNYEALQSGSSRTGNF